MNTIWEAIKFIVSRGALYGALLGALYGTFLFPIIGTIFGFVIGGLLGVFTGLPLGIIIGWVTRQFFPTVTHPLRYLWTLTLLAVVLGYAGAMMLIASWFNRQVIQIPNLIAAGAAGYATWHFGERVIKAQPETNDASLGVTPSLYLEERL